MSSTDARAARLALDALIAGAPPALPSGFADGIERYVALLLEANARLNLTRITAPEDVARLHLLDSLAALPWLDRWRPERAVDLGTGGGVPGVVLALARPEVTWTLVDSVARKAEAVRSFVAELGLASSVEVVADRVESLALQPGRREAADLVTARAVAPLPVLIEYAMPLLAAGGHLLAWKGRIDAAELEAGARAAALLGGEAPSVEPSGQRALGDHRFVVVRKERPTPAEYPRRPGVASRRPLG